PKTTVRDVEFGDEVTVWVRPQQRVMSCPHCDFRTRHRYDTRVVDSAWRHLDLGGRVCVRVTGQVMRAARVGPR
ncbi:MAG: hypothetical protein ACRDTV_22405, partial [Mycobacterium sp.]